MIEGDCHCGRVALCIAGPIHSHCHCQICRKLHSTTHGSSALVASEDFAVVKGSEHLTAYSSSPTKRRYFCSVCGSHLFAVEERRACRQVILHVGSLTPGHGLRPECHIFVEDEADWYTIRDDLPQYPGDAGP